MRYRPSLHLKHVTRNLVASALLFAVLVVTPSLSVLAQDAPDNAPTADPLPAAPIYLPMVLAPGGNEPGDVSNEVMISGSLFANEIPVFPGQPKQVADDPLPEGPAPEPDPEEKGAVPAEGDGVAPAATEGWTTVLNDGFETVPWPFAGWKVYDVDGTTNGVYMWDDDDFRPYRGAWSAWPANSALDPAFSNYAPNMRTWMIYGPFSLADASTAMLSFQYWSQTELNYDWMGWFASPDGNQFFGNWVSGDSNGWRPGLIDFSAVPGYGSMLGDNSVWIGFYFYSDQSTQLKGPFIDDIFIQKFNCPGQFTAYWHNSLTPSASTQRAVTCEPWPFARNWGTGAPLWLPPDNWMLRLVGTPFFSESRTYTFNARSDDGVRVTVDGNLVIDAWYDQGATVNHTAQRYLSAGAHSVVVDYYDRTGAAQLNVGWQ